MNEAYGVEIISDDTLDVGRKYPTTVLCSIGTYGVATCPSRMFLGATDTRSRNSSPHAMSTTGARVYHSDSDSRSEGDSTMKKSPHRGVKVDGFQTAEERVVFISACENASGKDSSGADGEDQRKLEILKLSRDSFSRPSSTPAATNGVCKSLLFFCHFPFVYSKFINLIL